MTEEAVNQSVNQALYEAALFRAALVEQYTRGVILEMERVYLRELIPSMRVAILDALESIGPSPTWTSARTLKALRGVEAVLQAKIDKTEAVLLREVSGLGRLEASWQQSALRRALASVLGKDASRAIRHVVDFEAPPAQMLKSFAKSKPMDGEFLSEWFKSLSTRAKATVRKAIRNGIALGETEKEIAQRVLGAAKGKGGALSATKSGLEGIARTAITHTSAQARQATFAENADVIESVLWVSTLDDRTTPLCQSLDGRTFPVNEGPRPPAHFNCRSTVVPVLKSWKELGIDLAEAPPGTRAALGGAMPETATYEDWLRKQDDKTKRRVLGKERARLFDEGRSFKSLFREDGTYLSLAELRAAT